MSMSCLPSLTSAYWLLACLKAVATVIPQLMDPLLGDSCAPASFAIFFRRHSMKNNKNAAKSSRSGGEKEQWVNKLAAMVGAQHTVCIGDPDVAVVVEVCGRGDSESGGVAFLCVATRALWRPLRRFSLRELADKGMQGE
jgi:hypothetical protein